MELNTSEFYFGNAYDLKSQAIIPDTLTFYDPEDLTTHAVITGMTGSGKTGMGIILLEEAALRGIPAILIDPKGDLTNHLLHFPDFLPSDFAPWVDADAAKREGLTVEEAAEAAAASWKKGTERSGIDRDRMEKLSTNVDYVIYTPGSDSAIPVSILSSLKAPGIDWEENKEMLRESISSTVTALLELVGFKNIDPVRSREHILLANIFETAWSEGRDLNLESLILQVQNPPFEKLGVFAVSKFYPEKDRFELAMLLNNFIAAPSFGSWLQGQPLDIQSLLYSADGKPKHSIFYLAHLADAERMFFITLLYSAVETWMRTQSGTSDLRALVYFDEIVGYLPPVSNPPSKPIILRMLKQARAFGVGLVLSTQNPIDLDYKALSNAGTWIIGKLQTDQDKQRLLDGLTNVSGSF
ncbi:MAG: type IV secretion system DNA-binding domain-containing protein, partial [Anaerolineaceae bacterium]|nr:type IV secretion system DNA-binding domain-containing protein [Anaerolineaceae bacterium]